MIRDTDVPGFQVARVESLGDLVRLEVRDGERLPECILVHPIAARRLAAALVIEAMRAEMVGLAAMLDRECEGKGGPG